MTTPPPRVLLWHLLSTTSLHTVGNKYLALRLDALRASLNPSLSKVETIFYVMVTYISGGAAARPASARIFANARSIGSVTPSLITGCGEHHHFHYLPGGGTP